MRNETMTFTGKFAKHIKNYLKEQKMMGYKIESYVYVLKSFDSFSQEYNNELTYLTKDLVINWLKPRINEKENNIVHRASKIRCFGKYMNLLDNKSYILPKNIYSFRKKYNAYIFSQKEICRFFLEVDQFAKSKPNSHTSCSLQIIFRLLYMCGLRISEVLNIKLENFDEEQRIIKIYNAKNDKDRIIPINTELNSLIINYISEFHIYSDKSTYLFKSRGDKPYSRFSIYYQFRNFLQKSEIEHSGDGPRIHDFRHTFAVHCLKKWSFENKDLMVYLPILKTYLGHENFKETAYYLKLTADIFPNITEKVEKHYNNLIPIEEELYEE